MFRSLLPSLRQKSVEARRPMSIADLMEDFWKEPFGLPAVFKDAGYPAVDVSEDEKTVTVKAELPGLEPKDVELTVSGDALIVKGEKKFEDEEKKDNYHRIERSYGSFYRAIPLPCAVDEAKAAAKYEKGVLTVTLPKAKPAEKSRIKIEGA